MACAVDPADHRALQRRPGARLLLDEIAPGEQHRCVGRKEAPVVPQHHEAGPGQPTVGREHVDHIHGAAGDRLVGERVLDDADIRQAEAVVPAQSRPAVVTLQKPGA